MQVNPQQAQFINEISTSFLNQSTVLIPPATDNPDTFERDPETQQILDMFNQGIQPDLLDDEIDNRINSLKERIQRITRIYQDTLNEIKSKYQADPTEEVPFNEENLNRYPAPIASLIDLLTTNISVMETLEQKLTEMEAEEITDNNTQNEIEEIMADLRICLRTAQYARSMTIYTFEQTSQSGDDFVTRIFNDEGVDNIVFTQNSLINSNLDGLHFDDTLLNEQNKELREKLEAALSLLMRTPTGNKLIELLKAKGLGNDYKISVSTVETSYPLDGINDKLNSSTGWIRFNSQPVRELSTEVLASIWANELFDLLGDRLTPQYDEGTQPAHYDGPNLTFTMQYQLLGSLLNQTIVDELTAIQSSTDVNEPNLEDYARLASIYGYQHTVSIGAEFSEEELQILNQVTELVTRGRFTNYEELRKFMNPYMNNR
jgi:hypothetical protein